MPGSDDSAAVARRDIVWDAVLRTLAKSPASIKMPDVRENIDREVSDRTIQRTMEAMRTTDWLVREKPQGHYWHPGPKALELLAAYGATEVEKVESYLSVQDGGESPDESEASGPVEPTTPSGAVDSAVTALDVPGHGDVQEDRREAIRQVLHLIEQYERIEVGRLKAEVFGRHPGEYDTERSWWKNCIYPALRESDLARPVGEGSNKWLWQGSGSN